MKELFMDIYNAKCDKICIENPVSLKIWNLPQYQQEIQPWQFGHPYTKKTRLWLKGLPMLHSTIVCEPVMMWVNSGKRKGKASTAKERSKTFEGIAKAMAEQWG